MEYLAPLVDDVELVLFEVDDYGSNLPDAPTISRLQELAAAHDLTYTVHLPLDLRLAADGGVASQALDKAHRCIDCTLPLTPWAYVLHLDGEELMAGVDSAGLRRWQDQARRSLEVAAGWTGDPGLLAVENLERWDPESFTPVIDSLPVSRCLDVGHYWLQGQDPLPDLRRWLPRTKVVHLHGVAERDHKSLAHVPPDRLEPVVRLLTAEFDGVVTLEVFGESDFHDSLAAWGAVTP